MRRTTTLAMAKKAKTKTKTSSRAPGGTQCRFQFYLLRSL
jgi:hypothetical protein